MAKGHVSLQPGSKLSNVPSEPGEDRKLGRWLPSIKPLPAAPTPGRVQVHSLLVTLAWVTLEEPAGAECSLGHCARCPGRFLSHLPCVFLRGQGSERYHASESLGP